MFQLELFIEHLMSQMGLKTFYLDLDLQGQIGLQTLKICVIPCECTIF